jgi:acetyl-CoA carboxylase biotin carboxyl carrier protein
MSSKTTRDSDVDFIQALAQVLRDNDLSEVEVKRNFGEKDSLNVKVSRHSAPVMMQAAAAPIAASAAAAPVAATPAAPTVSDDPASHPGAVTSPMVGTIYLSAEPGADPFATVGQTVNEGDTVLIVEAMKTMNHIPAPRGGTIKRILVDDGSAVEFGAPLMIIE